MYVFLRENEKGEMYASALIPIIPGIPIEQRYTAEFLANCVYTEEEVEQGWIYEDGHFHEPVEEVPEPPESEAEEE